METGKEAPAYLPRTRLSELEAALVELDARLTQLEAMLIQLRLDFEKLQTESFLLREAAKAP